jgi:hypothetical protein
MGMFDRLYDAQNGEWQTKAYARTLERYDVGDKIDAPAESYQVEVLGEIEGNFEFSFATVRFGILVAVPAERDYTLPRRNYSGHTVDDSDEADAEVGASHDRLSR